MADYEKLQRLGAGNFGEVWLVHDYALGVRRAVKYVPAASITDPTNFYNEPHALMELRHDNIVRVEDSGRLADGTLYISMEYLQRGSVESVFKGQALPISVALRIITDICWALEYAHHRDFIHRDIKPGNILLSSDGRAKLSDFGLATRVPRGAFASPHGYLTHVAPEVFRTNRTSKLSDIYALGVTAYRLLNGDGFLPDIHDASDIQDMILTGQYPDRDKYRPYIPTKVQSIINKCMSINPHERYQSPAAFRKALEALRICCNWKLRVKRRTVSYLTKIGQAQMRAVITRGADDKYSIVTTKQIGAGTVRRVAQDCEDGMTLGQMKKRIRRILPRYVMRGK